MDKWYVETRYRDDKRLGAVLFHVALFSPQEAKDLDKSEYKEYEHYDRYVDSFDSKEAAESWYKECKEGLGK